MGRINNVSLGDLVDLAAIATDGSSIDLIEDIAAHALDSFSCSVVGKMFGRRLPAHVIEGEIRKHWAQFGDFRFLMLRVDCFLFIFGSVAALDNVLQGGHWFING